MTTIRSQVAKSTWARLYDNVAYLSHVEALQAGMSRDRASEHGWQRLDGDPNTVEKLSISTHSNNIWTPENYDLKSTWRKTKRREGTPCHWKERTKTYLTDELKAWSRYTWLRIRWSPQKERASTSDWKRWVWEARENLEAGRELFVSVRRSMWIPTKSARWKAATRSQQPLSVEDHPTRSQNDL